MKLDPCNLLEDPEVIVSVTAVIYQIFEGNFPSISRQKNEAREEEWHEKWRIEAA
jgi:hypothetical protein